MMRPRPHPGNPPATGDPTAAYRHQARRLRHLYANRPNLLHQRLHKLSQTHNRQSLKDDRPPSLSSDSPIAWTFADRVTVQLENENGLLRYSSRIKLLDHAATLGIKRFEANLIIAVAQHRFRESHQPAVTPAPTAPYRRWIAPAAAAVGVQFALVAIAWWLGVMPL